MPTIISLSLSILLVLALCEKTLSSTCAYTATDGSYYDLSSLTNEYSISANDYNYKVMICRTLPTTCYGMTQSVCRISVWGGVEYACGTSAAQTFRDYSQTSQGVVVFYDGGEACGGTPRTSTVNVICDSSTEANLVSATEASGCDLIFNLRSRHACPGSGSSGGSSGGSSSSGGRGGGGGGSSGPLSGGSIILIIVSVGIVVYLIAGVFYKVKFVGAEGVERVPNVEFWTALPGLVKDGFAFTYHKIYGLFNRGNL